MMNNIIGLKILLFICIISLCQSEAKNYNKLQKNKTLEKGIVLPTNEIKKVMKEAQKSYKKGEKGIPELILIIEENICNLNSDSDAFAVEESIKYLYFLARKGIYSQTELPILFKALERIRVKRSLYAAETIEIISGLSVGYNWEFVYFYKNSDEVMRIEMINNWKKLIKKQKRLIEKSS